MNARPLLGTAQLGLDYGVVRESGRPSDDEAMAILAAAEQGGFAGFDTARAYGDSEARLGALLSPTQKASFLCVSKLAPLPSETNDPAALVRHVDDSLGRSLLDLQRPRVDVMMFHRAVDALVLNGLAVTRLSAHVERGAVGAIGVSVYTPEEALACLADRRIGHIQIPFNLLDSRWHSTSFQRVVEERAIIVHARSVFLQGLLLHSASRWPEWYRERAELSEAIERAVRDTGRANRADLCLAYVRAVPFVRYIVLGFDRAAHVQAAVANLSQPAMSAETLRSVTALSAFSTPRLLNPASW